jgi:hypothetical protein
MPQRRVPLVDTPPAGFLVYGLVLIMHIIRSFDICSLTGKGNYFNPDFAHQKWAGDPKNSLWE